MGEWKVYIENLGKYVEGDSTGAWFSVPIDIEEVKEKIGLNDNYEEYAIHDYELPFEIGEYESIERINDIYHALEDADAELLEDLGKLSKEFSNMEELIENKENFIFYNGVDSLEDLAMELVEEGCFGEIPESLQYYIDYQAIARDMDIEGKYVIGSHGIWEIGY